MSFFSSFDIFTGMQFGPKFVKRIYEFSEFAKRIYETCDCNFFIIVAIIVAAFFFNSTIHIFLRFAS